MPNHTVQVEFNGTNYNTLEDILPSGNKELTILFIGKVPTADSIEKGHYFQGRQGKAFWRMLRQYGILDVPPGGYDDDYLLDNGYGFIDVVKTPRDYGSEPKDYEYIQSVPRVIDTIKTYKPKIIVFVYKNTINKIMWYGFRKSYESQYGFNTEIENFLNAKVFGFPISGTRCKAEDMIKHMIELKEQLEKVRSGKIDEDNT